jgi:hypothetical protein
VYIDLFDGVAAMKLTRDGYHFESDRRFGRGGLQRIKGGAADPGEDIAKSGGKFLWRSGRRIVFGSIRGGA